MREHDDVECAAGAFRAMPLADSIFQWRDPDELRRGKRTDGDDQLRLQQADFAIEVRAAIRDLGRVRDAIAATLRIFSRKAADDRAHVHALPKLSLGNPEPLVEPSEETSPGRIRKGTSIFDLMRTGSLADEHHPCAGDRAGDGRAEDVRTEAAGTHDSDVFAEGDHG